MKREKFSTEFYIDASHELSLFAWNNGKGHKLTAVSYFCLEKKTGCAIYDDSGKPYSACVSKNKKIYFINLAKLLAAVVVYIEDICMYVCTYNVHI